MSARRMQQACAFVVAAIGAVPLRAQEPDDEARSRALAERAAVDGHRAVPDLLPLLGHADWRVRWHAVRGLGLARADWLDERVAALLDDRQVAPMAAHALGQLAGADDWPPLDRAQELVDVARRWWARRSAGEGWITHAAALSPGGDSVVFGQVHAELGTAYLVLCDARTGRERSRQRWSGVARSLAWSGDGARFAASTDDGVVRVLAAATATCVAEHRGHTGWPLAVELSADGRLLASSARDGVLLLRDAATGATSWRLTDRAATALLVERSGAVLAAEQAGDVVRVAADGGVTTLFTVERAVRAMALSPDGAALAVLQGDGTLSCWELAERRQRWSVAAHEPRPTAVAWSADGTRLATSGARRVRVWSAAGGERRHDELCPRTVLTLRAEAAGFVGAYGDGSPWRSPAEPSGPGRR